MEKKPADLLELSDAQKTEFLKHVNAYLKQRVAEERNYKSMLSSLEKDGVGLEFNSTIEGQYLKNTIEKIESLEAEKKSLLLEIDELKKTADTKAAALESEVKALREEVKSLKILMNESEPNVKPAVQKIKKAM
jgi:uncharacterized protein (UPF0335 family)